MSSRSPKGLKLSIDNEKCHDFHPDDSMLSL